MSFSQVGDDAVHVVAGDVVDVRDAHLPAQVEAALVVARAEQDHLGAGGAGDLGRHQPHRPRPGHHGHVAGRGWRVVENAVGAAGDRFRHRGSERVEVFR